MKLEIADVPPRPPAGMLPYEIAEWLAANPHATEVEKRLAAARLLPIARARFQAQVDAWLAELRAQRLAREARS